MQVFTSNTAARRVAPEPALAPSEGYLLRNEAAQTALQRIEAHMAATGEAASALGRRIANDPRLVFDLRAGRNINDKLDTKIDAFFAGAFHA